MTVAWKQKQKWRKTSSRTKVHLKSKGTPTTFKSRFEAGFARDLEERGIPFTYEEERINYTQERYYKPDFVLPNGIIIETKGYFYSADRKKHRLIKKQHPHLDIRFVFMNAYAKGQASKVTNAEWCIKNKFMFAENYLPTEWANEKRD